MRYQFSISAKDLSTPSRALKGLQAVLVLCHEKSSDGSETNAGMTTTIGETETLKDATRNPAWTLPLHHEFGNDAIFDDTVFAVRVTNSQNHDEPSTVASASFAGSELRQAHYKAVARYAARSGSKAKICLHAVPVEMGIVHLQIAAHDLPNNSPNIFFWNKDEHTDTFCEVFSSVTGEKIAQTDIVKGSLDPVWRPLDMDLAVLCGHNWDSPICIKVMEHKPQKKANYLGQVLISINEMIRTVKKQDSDNMNSQYHRIVRGGAPIPNGALYVRDITFDPQTTVSQHIKEDCQTVLTSLDIVCEKLEKRVSKARQQLTQVQKDWKIQQTIVDDVQEQVDQAQAKADEEQKNFEEHQQKLDELTVAAKTASHSGHLLLQLRAESLPDLDFGIRNVSDPMYEIVNQHKEVVVRSDVVNNNLNPTWNEQKLPLDSLGGLDRIFSVFVWDVNKGDVNSRQLCGSINVMTVEKLVTAANKKEGLSLGTNKGTLFVQQAKLEEYVDNRAVLEDYKIHEYQAAEEACTKAALKIRAVKDELVDAKRKAAEAERIFLAAKDEAESAQNNLDLAQRGSFS